MIHAIAIDDEPPALRVIENFCSRSQLVSLDKTFTSTAEAFKHIAGHKVDLLFLDIQMPSINGIDFYKNTGTDTMVIFTTAYSEYAVEGFNVNAVDYLLKPYTFERFNQAVHKAGEYQKILAQKNNDSYLVLRADYSLVKINIADILYIEGFDDYMKIYIENRKTLVVRMTMKAILEKLPETEFIRVHRSFIIPFSKIEQVRNKTILLAGNEIPVSATYEENLFKKIKK